MIDVLVIGGNGQLGLSIKRVANQFENVCLKSPSSTALDITNTEQLTAFFKKHSFQYCINCAAYTAVDKAESERESALKINALAVGELARLCRGYGVILIHISTDFVFNGTSKKPYTEEDEPSPINVYGKTKLAGEKLIANTLNTYFIIRTSWLFSEYRNNFLNTMLRLAKTKKEISVVEDQIGSPTYAGDLAKVILSIVSTSSSKYGIYHYSNSGETSWFHFANAIFALSKSDTNLLAIPSKDYKTAALRPKYSVLDTNKIKKNLGIDIPDWKESLKQAMESLQLKENLELAIKASLDAGKAIMEVYDSKIDVEYKADESPLTEADKRANDIINSYLIKTGIPIISEENKQIDYQVRKRWDLCWIVDPVDGTKEFIKRNGEFTVNIALVKNQKPILGVIYVPASKTLYMGNVQNQSSYKLNLGSHNTPMEEIYEKKQRLSPSVDKKHIRIVGSRSHMSQETLDYIEHIKERGHNVDIVSKGSSLKFCLIAEGLADIYPRFAPTMEWDTAAGQAICNALDINVISEDTKEPLTYNKENLLNPWFIVKKRNATL